MKKQLVRPAQKFKGTILVPGDKSVSHRGLLFGALADGKTEILRILESGDVQSTARCLSQLGVEITKEGRGADAKTFVKGVGLRGLKESHEVLDCGNSGTTMRLIMGILAGQNFKSELTGDSSLVKRPMKRVSEPLRQMGANFTLTNENYAPLKIVGGKLKGINYELKVPSAQIKSSILLAGLLAEGTTTITGKVQSRDHTERLLPYFGAAMTVSRDKISIEGGQKLHSVKLNVPGDPSTAAFWIAAASMIPGSHLTLKNVSLNPTRTGFIQVLLRMGANIETRLTETDPEPIGDVIVKHARLKGTNVSPEEIPALIDELPLFAVLASQAEGPSIVEGAEELRVKESDRIEALANGMRKMGAKIETREDGYLISGPQKLQGAEIETYDDHRIAMSFSIAGLIANGVTTILDPDCVAISYPDFYNHLAELTT